MPMTKITPSTNGNANGSPTRHLPTPSPEQKPLSTSGREFDKLLDSCPVQVLTRANRQVVVAALMRARGSSWPEVARVLGLSYGYVKQFPLCFAGLWGKVFPWALIRTLDTDVLFESVQTEKRLLRNRKPEMAGVQVQLIQDRNKRLGLYAPDRRETTVTHEVGPEAAQVRLEQIQARRSQLFMPRQELEVEVVEEGEAEGTLPHAEPQPHEPQG